MILRGLALLGHFLFLLLLLGLAAEWAIGFRRRLGREAVAGAGRRARAVAERVRAHPPVGRLERLSETGAVDERVTIPASGLLIGRGAECDLIIEDPYVSKTHAAITADSGGVWVEDLASTNGTRIGDERLLPGQRYPLRDGDEVLMGPYQRLRFRARESELP